MKMDDSAIETAVAKLPGWSRQKDSIARSYSFADFRTAFAFMTACALTAEKMDHHPDWKNSYSRVDVQLTTHDSGGITERDLILAAQMNEIAARLAG